MRPPKVVFDTNIFISAIVFGGNPETCLELAREGKMKLATSKAILLELAKKLSYKFGMRQASIKKIIEGISKFTEIVKPASRVDLIKRDPSDNKILEVAREIKADYIISGDKKHILALKKFEDTKIITAADFIKQFKSEKPN